MNHKQRTAPRAVAPIAAGTAVLGIAAVANTRAARRAEARTPPIGRMLTIDGVRVHVFERGEGPPIVLLHGNGAMAQDWLISTVVDRLAERHRVVIVERPGFGHTERPRDRVWTPAAQAALVRATLDELGTGPATIVGHSWGTLVALAHALEYPRATAALGLLSGYYFPTARLDVVGMSLSAVPGIGDVLRYTINPLIGRLITPAVFKKIFAPSPVTPAFRQRFPRDLALRPSQLRAASADTALMVPGAAQLSPRYGELTMPMLIAAGDGDRIARYEHHAQRLAESFPDAELLRLRGAGHMIHHIAPKAVAEAIMRLASKTDEHLAGVRAGRSNAADTPARCGQGGAHDAGAGETSAKLRATAI